MFNADDHAGEPRRSIHIDRTSTITPVDLRQARLGTAVRGFDKAQVTALLTEAADGYDMALRENERLRQEIARLDAALAQFRDLETSLKNTLISAQKATDDMKENATQEAARIIREAEGRVELISKKGDEIKDAASQEASRIIREAEGRAEIIVRKAEARREELESDLDTLKSKRRDAEVSVEAIIAILKSTLDEFHEQERAELEDRAPLRSFPEVSRSL